MSFHFCEHEGCTAQAVGRFCRRHQAGAPMATEREYPAVWLVAHPRGSGPDLGARPAAELVVLMDTELGWIEIIRAPLPGTLEGVVSHIVEPLGIREAIDADRCPPFARSIICKR